MQKKQETRTTNTMNIEEDIQELKDIKFMRENMTKEEIIQRHVNKINKINRENLIGTLLMTIGMIMMFILLVTTTCP